MGGDAVGKAHEQREISLDGKWRIVFDPENRGKEEKWFALSEPPRGGQEITVPGCWELINPGYDGVAWYWRTFEVPKRYENQITLLRFDAVNNLADVWIDGKYVGRCEGGYTPFTFDVTDIVREGEAHRLVVRVIDLPKQGEIDGVQLKELPCWRELESFNFGGIWQPVKLLVLPPLYIEDCFVQPMRDLSGATVKLTLNCREPGLRSAEVQLDVFEARRGDAAEASLRRTIPLKAGRQSLAFDLSLPNPKLWSPDQPNLYLLKAALSTKSSRGAYSDAVRVRFGLRMLTMERGRFVLNGKPVFVKGAFHEGLYPMTLAAPPSREFVIDEMRKAKQAGFNLLRFWQIPIHPVVLDVADELGMMLCDEPPIEWMLQTEKTVDLCRGELERMVMRDRNHPSVVMWCILNEGGALKELQRFHTPNELLRTPIQKAIGELCQLVRQLDRTRIIIDESGGWAGGANVYLPYSSEAKPINDVHRYLRGPTAQSHLTYLRTLGEEDVERGRWHVRKGVSVFVTEFGYGSIPDLPRIVREYQKRGAERNEDYVHHKSLLQSLVRGFAENKMGEIFSDIGELITLSQEIHARTNYLQALAIRANPLACGYVMHAFSAGGCILGAEAFDMWRGEKLVARAIAQANAPRVLAVFVDAAAYERGRDAKAEVVLCAEDADGETELPLSLTISGESGFEQTVELGLGKCARGVTTVWQGAVKLPREPGRYRLTFAMKTGDEVWAKGERTVWVLDDAAEPLQGRVALVGPGRGAAVRQAVEEMGAQYVSDVADADYVIAVLPLADAAQVSRLRQAAAEGKRVLLLAEEQRGIAQAIEALQLEGRAWPARGNWSPVCHYVVEQKLMRGLPRDKLLGEAYAEVVPNFCILPIQGETLAGCLGYGDGTAHSTPMEFWWGSTVIRKRTGRGTVLLCTFRLKSAVGYDGVARRVLGNLLRCFP